MTNETVIRHYSLVNTRNTHNNSLPSFKPIEFPFYRSRVVGGESFSTPLFPPPWLVHGVTMKHKGKIAVYLRCRLHGLVISLSFSRRLSFAWQLLSAIIHRLVKTFARERPRNRIFFSLFLLFFLFLSFVFLLSGFLSAEIIWKSTSRNDEATETSVTMFTGTVTPLPDLSDASKNRLASRRSAAAAICSTFSGEAA